MRSVFVAVLLLAAVVLPGVTPAQAQSGASETATSGQEIWITYQEILASDGGDAAYDYLGAITTEEQAAFTDFTSQVIVSTEGVEDINALAAVQAAGCYTESGSVLYESALNDNLFRFFQGHLLLH